MAKSSSRSKRRRAAVRSAKRTKTNTWWYGLTALILIAGIALVAYARANNNEVVPLVYDQNQPASSAHNVKAHLHAALGVYDCDHWVGDDSGTGLWAWPATTPDGRPAQANNTAVYAGMHSHADGIIHMEPTTADAAGKHATVGKYFSYGGWDVSSSGYDFLSGAKEVKVKNGDKCGSEPGKLQWATAKLQGSDTGKQVTWTEHTGNPGSFKLNNDDVVVIAFLPQSKSVVNLPNPPSVAKLPDAFNAENGNTTPTTLPTFSTSPPSTAKTSNTTATSPTTSATATTAP
ncbi:MAG TPA: hypothetical protein VL856_06170 [Acidimicrobiia bacterium]|nr:hypothetical protein [Acidimicrobiia bacterium]